MPLGKPGTPREPGEGAGRRARLLPIVLGAGLVLLFAAACGGFLLLLRERGWIGIKVLGGLAAAGVAFAFVRWATARGRPVALRRALGLAPGVGEVARRLRVPEQELRALRPSYRELRIPKRRGGQRVLHVPDARTMEIQRRILHRLLARMESHPAAYGFERGRSIAHNAAQHAGRALVLRFDVVDFFPATRAGRVERMFLRFGWSAEAAALLTGLVTHGGGLPQGAPTSPRLSNLVNAGLDRELTRRIERRCGRYTRYADDVTVSFPEDWIGEPERTGAAVRRAFALRGYRMHGKEKSSVRRRHQRQVVNGLVVNRRVALPRRLRRLLRAARHRLSTGRRASFTAEQLEGWAAFEGMVSRHGAEAPPPWRRETRPGNPGRRRP